MPSGGQPESLSVRPDSESMVRALGLMYVAGPTVALVSVILPHPDELDVTAVVVVSAVAYACSPLLLLVRRIPLAVIGLMIAFANVLVTLVVYFGGESASPFAFFYVWATPLAFAFFSLRHAAAQALFAGALYAGAMTAVEVDSGANEGRWLFTMSAVAVVGLIVRSITRALREEHARVEEERRRRAIEINDNVVQGLVLAKAWSERGMEERRDQALTETLSRAQEIIDDLLGDRAEGGALRRTSPADRIGSPAD